jgi:hypothetical protein
LLVLWEYLKAAQTRSSLSLPSCCQSMSHSAARIDLAEHLFVACSAAKRPRPAALEATVATITIPGLGSPNGICAVTKEGAVVSTLAGGR